MRLRATAAALWTLIGVSVWGCASSPAPRAAQRASGFIPVGVAEIDITPKEAIRLTGYGNREQPTEDVRQRLWARAIAFGDDAAPAVLIAVDLIGVPRTLTEDVARRLADAGVAGTVRHQRDAHAHGTRARGVLPYIFNVPGHAAQQEVIDSYTSALSASSNGRARRTRRSAAGAGLVVAGTRRLRREPAGDEGRQVDRLRRDARGSRQS